MLFRLAGKVLWRTSKFTVKHVAIPIAITAVTAVALEELADRLRKEPNGHGRRAQHRVTGGKATVKPAP